MRRGTVYPFLGVSRGHRVETLREYSSDEELFDIQPRNLWPDTASPEPPAPPSPELQPGTTTPVCPPFEIFRDPDIQDEIESSSSQHTPHDQYPATPVNSQNLENSQPHTSPPSSRPPLGELQPSPEYPPEDSFEQILEQEYEEDVEEEEEEEVLPSTPDLDQMYPGVFDDHDSPTEEGGLIGTPPPPTRQYRSPSSDQGYHHGSSPARSPGSVSRGYTSEMVTCTQQLPQGIPATTPVYTTVNAIQQPADPPNSALNAPLTSAPPSPAVYGAVSMPNPFDPSPDGEHMPSFQERQQRKEEAKSRLGVVVRGIKIPRPSDILDYSDGPTTFGPRALWTQPSDAEVDHYAIGPSPPAHSRSDAAEYHIYDQFEDEEYDAEYEDAQYEYDYYEQQLGENEEEHVEHDADQSYYGDHEDEDKDVVYDEEDKENHPTAEQFAECHMITPQSRRLFGHNERVIGRRIGRTYDSIEPSPTMVERAIALGVFLAPKVKRRAGRFECKRDHTTDPPAEARICNFFDNCWGERQPIVGLGSMRGRWILDEPEDEAEDAEGRVDKIRRVGRGPHWSKLVHAVESTPSSLNSPSSSGLPQLSFSCSTLDSSMSSSFVDENPPWSLSREDSIADYRVNKHQLLPPSLRSSNVQTVQEADEQDVLAE